METKQEITPLFIAKVNEIIDKNILRNRKEVVDILEWTESGLSNVMAGRRPVPHDKAAKLFKLYGTGKSEKVQSANFDPIAAMQETIDTLKKQDLLRQDQIDIRDDLISRLKAEIEELNKRIAKPGK